LVYINKIDQIKNVNDTYIFEHFVKKLYPNVGKFEEFNDLSHMEFLGDFIITIDPIDDKSFRYQSDNIQEFTTILRKYNPQNILNICEKHRIATIYDKTSLNLYFNIHSIY
ncbi:23595_t:CDS:2, partial [Gigaspora margarita]